MSVRSSARSGAIDGLRAVAVLLVLLAHAMPAGAGFTRIGVRGVDLFFVISGLCMSLVLARDPRPRIVPFVASRFARIAPPYYVALALFAALSLTSFGYPTVPAGAIPSPQAAARELLMDVAFSTTAAPVHDVSFWTLSVEMRWYLLCVPLVLVWRRSRAAFATIALACYGAYWLTPFGIADEGTLPAFMLGIVAGSIDPALLRGARARALGLATAAALALLVATDLRRGVPVDHGSPFWHVAFFGLVLCARSPAFERAFAWRPLAAIGLASYAIYLVHQPVLLWLSGFSVPLAVAAAGALGTGLAFYALVERPLARADRRQRLIARILRTPRAPHVTSRPAASAVLATRP